ncbi:hypothetical protein [Bacillus cereus]|uniref:hypothetical protein n=1 Tax=Bacillus TaxID=1386 RepID=UPI001379373F|nr:hypothetical protein [Bacillus cereus]
MQYIELCVILAGIAYKVFEEKGKDTPNILNKWQEICKIDSFLEVRRQLHLFLNKTE